MPSITATTNPSQEILAPIDLFFSCCCWYSVPGINRVTWQFIRTTYLLRPLIVKALLPTRWVGVRHKKGGFPELRCHRQSRLCVDNERGKQTMVCFQTHSLSQRIQIDIQRGHLLSIYPWGSSRTNGDPKTLVEEWYPKQRLGLLRVDNGRYLLLRGDNKVPEWGWGAAGDLNQRFEICRLAGRKHPGLKLCHGVSSSRTRNDNLQPYF